MNIIKSAVRICPTLCHLFGTYIAKYVPNSSFAFFHNLQLPNQYSVIVYCVAMITMSLDVVHGFTEVLC